MRLTILASKVCSDYLCQYGDAGPLGFLVKRKNVEVDAGTDRDLDAAGS